MDTMILSGVMDRTGDTLTTMTTIPHLDMPTVTTRGAGVTDGITDGTTGEIPTTTVITEVRTTGARISPTVLQEEIPIRTMTVQTSEEARMPVLPGSPGTPILLMSRQ